MFRGVILVVVVIAGLVAAAGAVGDSPRPAASAGLTTLTPLAVGSDQAVGRLGGHWQLLEDPTASLSLDAVRASTSTSTSAELPGGGFQPLSGDSISKGFSASAFWLRFAVQRDKAAAQDWLLEIDYPLLDRIDVYWRESGSESWSHQLLGDQLPFTERPLPHRTFVMPVALSADAPVEFYLRVESASSLQLRASLWAASGFFEVESRDNIIFGLIYGMMLMMALYNGFLYVAVRDPSYLAYVAATVSGTIFIMSVNGHAAQFLWPQAPRVVNLLVPISAAMWVVATAVFTQLFLATRSYSVLAWRFVNAMIGAGLVVAAAGLLLPYTLAIKVTSLVGLINGLVLLGVSLLCLWRGNQAARFFTMAWLVYAAGISTLIGNRLGLLPNTVWTQHAATFGMIAEIIVLSVALSDKYRLMTWRLREQSRNLEQTVTARTADLEEANLKLRELAQRDSLTRLANRRMYDSTLASEWDRHRREESPLALLVIDVDQFKSLNDQFGHPYGDSCLKAVATVMSETLRRPADLAARYGGDEFTVILPDTNEVGAAIVGQRILDSVRELAIRQAADADYSIATLSIGVAALVPGRKDELETLASAADAALYRAKEGGRNRVVAASRPAVVAVA